MQVDLTGPSSERKVSTPEGQRMKEQLAQTAKQIKLQGNLPKTVFSAAA